MVNSRPAHDELRTGYYQKQPASCSPAPDLVTRLPRRSGASTFLGISVCISAAPAALDRYLAASSAMSLIPFTPFSISAFQFFSKGCLEVTPISQSECARISRADKGARLGECQMLCSACPPGRASFRSGDIRIFDFNWNDLHYVVLVIECY